VNNQENSQTRIKEILILNTQKGSPFLLRFKNDPVDYVGMPILHSELDSDDDDDEFFSFRISSPPEKKGIQRRKVAEVESIEPV
jgi:hypothetical protein